MVGHNIILILNSNYRGFLWFMATGEKNTNKKLFVACTCKWLHAEKYFSNSA